NRGASVAIPSRGALRTVCVPNVLRALAPRLFPTEKRAFALASRRPGTRAGRLFSRPRRAIAPFRQSCNGPLLVTRTRPAQQFSVGNLFNKQCYAPAQKNEFTFHASRFQQRATCFRPSTIK